MHLIKKAAAGAAVMLLPAAVALAASAPSGVFQGTIHSHDAAGHPDTYQIQATFSKGKLTRIAGQGNWIPYDPSKSNSEACGAANTFDSSASGDKATISGSSQSDGSFSYRLTDKFHTVITLKGRFVSASTARTHFRFYQSHLPLSANGKFTMTGHCDSGQMKLPLTAG